MVSTDAPCHLDRLARGPVRRCGSLPEHPRPQHALGQPRRCSPPALRDHRRREHRGPAAGVRHPTGHPARIGDGRRSRRAPCKRAAEGTCGCGCEGEEIRELSAACHVDTTAGAGGRGDASESRPRPTGSNNPVDRRARDAVHTANSKQSQHTVTAHSHSIQSQHTVTQHTVTACIHSAPSQHRTPCSHGCRA